MENCWIVEILFQNSALNIFLELEITNDKIAELDEWKTHVYDTANTTDQKFITLTCWEICKWHNKC